MRSGKGSGCVVDSSAVLSILLGESDAERYFVAFEQATTLHMSAANYVETAIVVDNRGDAIASREFDRLIVLANIEIMPVTFEQAQTARLAHRDFGKGRHRASLNYGDCFSYALAKALDLPLLYKGTDFGKTDIRSFL